MEVGQRPLIGSMKERRMDSQPNNPKAPNRNLSYPGRLLAILVAAVAGWSAVTIQTVQAQQQPVAPSGQRPNILVIWGDDVGLANVSAYSFGIMGIKTPNIDRIGREGLMFTDYYAEQSCTAGRASFVTGQSGLRTGMTKVGLPGAALGLQPQDITIAEALKPLGYATGQFGKNHLGDRNEFLPTVHGFDEFFGNLYHLNAEEEPEHPDYPKDPAFKAKFGPRGVLKSKATDRDDPTFDPRFGSSVRSKPTNRSSFGGTARACTSTRMCGRNTKAVAGSANTWMACSNTTGMSGTCSRRSMISASPTTPS
jgi:hypothetical protein